MVRSAIAAMALAGCAAAQDLHERAAIDFTCREPITIAAYRQSPRREQKQDQLVSACGEWGLYVWICWRGNTSWPAWCSRNRTQPRDARGCTWCLVRRARKDQCHSDPPVMNYPLDILPQPCD